MRQELRRSRVVLVGRLLARAAVVVSMERPAPAEVETIPPAKPPHGAAAVAATSVALTWLHPASLEFDRDICQRVDAILRVR
jgi:hypothetical protein